MRASLAWPVLLISAVFEAVWATALGLSAGFTRPIPTVVFLVGLTCSMLGAGLGRPAHSDRDGVRGVDRGSAPR